MVSVGKPRGEVFCHIVQHLNRHGFEGLQSTARSSGRYVQHINIVGTLIGRAFVVGRIAKHHLPRDAVHFKQIVVGLTWCQ